MKLLSYIAAVVIGLYLIIGFIGETQAYPITGTATISVIHCVVDAKPLVSVRNGDLSKGSHNNEEVPMDMLTFYCQIHADFQGDRFLISHRSDNPPKRGSTVKATLIDEYTLMLHQGDF